MGIPYKKNPTQRPAKGRRGKEVLPTVGDTRTKHRLGWHRSRDGGSQFAIGSDILSALKNLVTYMRTSLYNGQSVNIRNFDVFSLGAHTRGTEKSEVLSASIR